VSQYFKTKFPGVRFRKHATRKHGVNFDQYFLIRYQHKGKRIEEGLGWASQGWTAEKANAKLARLKMAAKTGEGPQRLHEARKNEEDRRKLQTAREEAQKIAAITFTEFFDSTYLPEAKANKKKDTWETEERLHRLWIKPIIGNLSFRDIRPLHLEKIKAQMRQGKRENSAPKKSKPRPLSPKSINYALAVIRQVWNQACRDGLVTGDWPGKAVKKPVVKNKSIRFLTREEADLLLAELYKKSPQLHDMAALSLYMGLRAGEVFSLRWENINFEKDMLLAVDTKNSETRAAYMTPGAKEILERRSLEAEGNGLVFLNNKGNQIDQVSSTFARVVDSIGLNAGVNDARMKVTFHTMRHTYASWLVENGVDLYTVKVLLGHKSIKMTERYAHLGENAQRKAVRNFSKALEDPKEIAELFGNKGA